MFSIDERVADLQTYFLYPSFDSQQGNLKKGDRTIARNIIRERGPPLYTVRTENKKERDIYLNHRSYGCSLKVQTKEMCKAFKWSMALALAPWQIWGLGPIVPSMCFSQTIMPTDWRQEWNPISYHWDIVSRSTLIAARLTGDLNQNPWHG